MELANYLGECVPVWKTAEQVTPPFIQDWKDPAKLGPVKKFRNTATEFAARPIVAIHDSLVFRGFTIRDEAVALIDPFPCPDSLAYVKSLYPKMPVRELKGHAFEEVPDYADTWIVTCVPHGISTDPRGLAALQKHKETDFYKCFFHTVLYSSCAGGWLLVPLAFFLGLNDTMLRYTFMSRYSITSVHSFDTPVLREDPCAYVSVCFHRNEGMLDRQLIPWTLGTETRLFPVNKDTNWILCADLYQLPKSKTIEVKRFFSKSSGKEEGVTGLVLHATDAMGCGTRISMSYEPHKQYGSVTSKNIATLVVNGCTLTEREQRRVAEEFTIFVEQMRAERWSLFLSPMDETGNSRRRITFKLAFEITEHIIFKIKGLF
jgi:hypothetical protein